jgi:acyl dehydratase
VENDTLITEPLKDLLGKEQPVEYFDIEKGHLKTFADAIGDPNPLWTDIEYAKKSKYGTLIAPPTFLIDAGIIKLGDKLIALEDENSGGFINGSTEIEYMLPIKLGDTIKTTAKLIDIKEKEGKSGKLLFMTIEVNYYNQNGDLVRRCRDIFIRPQKTQE